MNKQRIEKKCGVHKYIDSNVCPAHYPVLTMWQLKDCSQIFLASALELTNGIGYHIYRTL